MTSNIQLVSANYNITLCYKSQCQSYIIKTVSSEIIPCFCFELQYDDNSTDKAGI